jgi:hypothetical protein
MGSVTYVPHAKQMTMQLANYILFAVPSLNVSWAIVLFFLILGMIVTLSPSRRTSEIKKPKED